MSFLHSIKRVDQVTTVNDHRNINPNYTPTNYGYKCKYQKKANLTLCRNSAFAGNYYGEEVWQRECKQKSQDPRNASDRSSFSLFTGKGLQTIKLVRKGSLF